MIRHPFLAAAAAFSIALMPLAAQAQTHEGDIELSVVGGRIVVGGEVHGLNLADGYKVFEADFGDLAGGPYRTDDPGFDNEPGTFMSGQRLNYTALGSLSFWNGSTWGSMPAVAANPEFLVLEGNLGELTRFGFSGISGDVTGLVGQAGSNGQIHEHLDFSVARTAGGAPAVGAYLIQLRLSGSGLSDSQPYYMAMNRGLSEANFEVALNALTVTPVPEPASWAMLAAGLGLLSAAARRRRINS